MKLDKEDVLASEFFKQFNQLLWTIADTDQIPVSAMGNPTLVAIAFCLYVIADHLDNAVENAWELATDVTLAIKQAINQTNQPNEQED